jgi:hypothetical protein
VGHPGRNVARVLALEHAAHAIPDREQEIERRRRDPDNQLDPGAQARVRWRGSHTATSVRPLVELFRAATIGFMEGSGFGGLFGDPDELQRRLGEFAEQMQGAQRLAWADNAIKLAVDLTMAAMNRVNIQGTTEQQAEQLRSVMATVFPEAVTLVREAREGLQ